MSNEKIISLFSRDGRYHFSRWAKPISPVIFGVDDNSLSAIKSAFLDVVSLSSLRISDFDQELGANFLVFFCSEWEELIEVPNLNRLIPDLKGLVGTLKDSQANQYRTFSFTVTGAINLVVVLLRYDLELASVSVQTLTVSQVLQSLLLWSPTAFKSHSPISIEKKTQRCFVKPFFEALIKAAYDPVLPDYSLDESHAMRLTARVSILLEIK